MARVNLSGRPLHVWTDIADDDAVPEVGPVTVSFARLVADGSTVTTRQAPLGVRLPNDVDVRDLKPFITNLETVFLSFPVFGDGRAYSQARRLRDALAFRGTLVATGDVLADQALFMSRVGIDVLELADHVKPETVTRTLARYSVFYQPASAGSPAAFELRHPPQAERRAS